MRRVRKTRRTTATRRRTRRQNTLWDRITERFHFEMTPARRWLMYGTGALTAGGVMIGGILWASGVDLPGRIANATRAAVADVTLWAGFSVREVYVAGRKEATRAQLLDALQTRVGEPILFFDPDGARQRLEDLGWVAEARIERRLPDTILVYLTEREPVAIWQKNKKFLLVDKGGAIIGSQGLDRYRDLKIIIGDTAPKHAAALLAMLAAEPEMMERVTHAVWVSGRRWNIRIEDAIDIRLPAENPEAAWRKLSELEKEHGLLKRDISAVDLRVPDKMTVRMNRKPTAAAHRGDQT